MLRLHSGDIWNNVRPPRTTEGAIIKTNKTELGVSVCVYVHSALLSCANLLLKFIVRVCIVLELVRSRCEGYAVTFLN